VKAVRKTALCAIEARGAPMAAIIHLGDVVYFIFHNFY